MNFTQDLKDLCKIVWHDFGFNKIADFSNPNISLPGKIKSLKSFNRLLNEICNVEIIEFHELSKSKAKSLYQARCFKKVDRIIAIETSLKGNNNYDCIVYVKLDNQWLLLSNGKPNRLNSDYLYLYKNSL